MRNLISVLIATVFFLLGNVSSSLAQSARPPAAKALATIPVPTAPDPGARAFLQCRSCHTVGRGQADMVGPNLAGFMGTRVATHRPGFAYSPATKASTLVWTDATLDRWLENPAATIPGTTMAFAGIKKPETRAALIAYLKRETR